MEQIWPGNKKENLVLKDKNTGINYFKNDVKVYFVGGCTLDDLENHGELDNLKQGIAKYKVIRPITKGWDALEILEILEKDILHKLEFLWLTNSLKTPFQNKIYNKNIF